MCLFVSDLNNVLCYKAVLSYLFSVYWGMLCRIIQKNRIDNQHKISPLTCWYGVTCNKGVPIISFRTCTDWTMINNSTVSIMPACSFTWVLAFVVDASLCTWTFTVDDTFWSTFNVRISLKVRWTGTDGSLLLFTTVSVDSARRWITWIRYDWFC